MNHNGLLFLFAMLAALVSAGCAQDGAFPVDGGDAERGIALIRQSGCGSCHHIPGIASATGQVGPPLDHLARRAYLAGILPNNHENLVRWIARPQAVAPGSAMPDLGLSPMQAADIAQYLRTLE